MKADEFAKLCRREKDSILKEYSEGSRLSALDLDEEQTKALRLWLNDALTDAFYTLLLGLDGSASIGGVQQIYKVHDESGELISECGELEAAAYDHFQDDDD